MKPLTKDFYERDPVQVARELLGKTLIRKLSEETLSGKIVETEAYMENDIASKVLARRKLFKQLEFAHTGTTFIYMVHGNWLLNIVAHPLGGRGGVLVRAVEPLQGAETMVKNRSAKNQRDLTNGPGKLTRALAITKELNRIDVTNKDSELIITEGPEKVSEIVSSHRIGVSRDLPQELRFFIKGNRFVSRPA